MAETKRVQLTQPGWVILIAIAVLLIMGTSSILVTHTHYSKTHDGTKHATKQLIFSILGLGLGYGILRIGHYRIAPLSYFIFAATLLALVPLVVAHFTHNTFGGLMPLRNGAHRWIKLPGFQFQPSEVMKVAYVLALAWYLRYRRNYRRLGGLLLPFGLTGVPLGLILLQPDLGTALLLVPVLFVMMFMAGARLKHLGLIVLICIMFMPLAWFQIESYQKSRISAVLLQSDRLRRAVIEKPEQYKFLAEKRQAIEWAASSGYQLVHSKNAIGSGGWFGQGWGEGIYVEYGRLPDRHNDMIFAIIAHQFGFFGSLLLLAAYGTIIIAGIVIASSTTDPYGRLLAIGVVTLLTTQVLINVSMTLGLMPITGMSLPFVSYGGSGLLTNFMAIALLVSVSRHRPFTLATKPFEFSTPAQRALMAEKTGISR